MIESFVLQVVDVFNLLLLLINSKVIGESKGEVVGFGKGLNHKKFADLKYI